ncbi:hypothetical protein [Myroides marinus]|uniref:hypothetical protein n=1 Tax=Myroides marinus TaxID=703342 RepID=UPI002574AA96|nr:hypothetical protein [Myroides marinus]MDM1379753.1 hypothetical protein [Myroides marinus]MDM1387024.1 hypothetical protein [Myroides marinus]MDM1394286.1 hypothetical protein [Myroides marinus]
MKKIISLLMLASLVSLCISCSKNYELERKDAGEYGCEVWQGHFIVQDGVRIPLLFGVEDKEGARQVRIVSGSELAHWSYWHEGEVRHESLDSISFKSGLHSEFRGTRNEDKISGVYLDGVMTKVERAKFEAEKVDKQQSPFPSITNPTTIVPTGTWRLDFGTLKDLSDSRELLRYNIDRVQTFDLYRKEGSIIGKAYGAGGVQGFDGIMTENGFICSSFHHSEPFLIEGTFVDKNTFNAKITSTTDVYNVVGKRSSQTKEDVKHTGSVLSGLYRTLRAFFWE